VILIVLLFFRLSQSQKKKKNPGIGLILEFAKKKKDSILLFEINKK
jgi:hypothetical protein